MHRFSLSLSELYDEIEKYPKDYMEFYSLGVTRVEIEQSMSGNTPIDDSMPEGGEIERRAVEARGNEIDNNIFAAKEHLRKAGIV